MSDGEQQNWLKRHVGVLAIVAVVIIIGLAAAVALLVMKRPATAQNRTSTQRQSTNNEAASSSYKLTACKSGSVQTIANASYVVGTDIAPGSYKIVSQPAGTDWTNINIYNSKAEYVKQGSPSVEQGNPETSLSPQNNVPTYTKLSDGQYMQVDADPATFTCE